MSPDAVLFDLDGTLVEYDRSPAAVLDAAFDRARVEPFFEVEAYYARFDDFLGESDGRVDHRERCFAAIASDRGRDPELGRRVAAAYAAERDPADVSVLPGAERAVAAAAGRPVGLVTNGPPAYQRPKLEATGLEDAFDAVVFAGHDAPAKPDPEPFAVALEALGATPSGAVYVGNSPESDVAGARNAGLSSVLVAPEPLDGPEPDRRVPDLYAVADAVRR